jgi:hypothetical protein
MQDFITPLKIGNHLHKQLADAGLMPASKADCDDEVETGFL